MKSLEPETVDFHVIFASRGAIKKNRCYLLSKQSAEQPSTRMKKG